MRRSALAALALLLLAADGFAAGMLGPRDGGEPMTPRSQEVVVEIEDGFALVTLRQTFLSARAGAVDALYEFPVPEDAMLAGAAVTTAGMRLEGILVPLPHAELLRNRVLREEGELAYIPGTVHGQFRLPVSPVLPGKEVEVEVRWVRPIPLRGGAYDWSFPLDDPAAKHTFRIAIRSSAPMSSVTSPTDNLGVVVIDPHHAVAAAEDRQGEEGGTVALRAEVELDEPHFAVETSRRAGSIGWFRAVVTLPVTLPDEEVIPRDVIMVLDTSGSMKGTKIVQAKAAATYLLNHLGPDDRVNIVRFHTEVTAFAPGPVAATPENLEALRAFVDRFVAGGGTALGEGLAKAIDVRVAKGRVRTVVLLTDGKPSGSHMSTRDILGCAALGAERGLRIYTFGIRPFAGEHLLEGIAMAGEGEACFLEPGVEIRSRLQKFLDRTSRPGLAEVEVDALGIDLQNVLPDPIPEIYAGEQLVVTGRYLGGGPRRIRIRGLLASRRVDRLMPLEFRVKPGGPALLPLRHGRARIRSLHASSRLRSVLSPDAFAKIDPGNRTANEHLLALESAAISFELGLRGPATAFLLVRPEDRGKTAPRSPVAVEAALVNAQKARVALLPEAVTDPEKPALARLGRIHLGAGVPPHIAQANAMRARVRARAAGRTAAAPAKPAGPPPWQKPDYLSERFKDRRMARNAPAKTTEAATSAGLLWLLNHQSPTGRWGARDFTRQCKLNPCSGTGNEIHDTGVTGLALLAFLGNGESPKHGPRKDAILRGVKWLMAEQQPDGCFAKRDDRRFVYQHAIATQVLAEAYSMTGSVYYKSAAQDGLDWIAKAQNPYLAWRYGIRPKDNDTSVSAWMTMALWAGKEAGLRVDQGSFDGMTAWLAKVTDPEQGRAGYTSRGNGPVRDAPLDEMYPPERSESLTAAAMFCRVLLGEKPRRSEMIRKGAILCARRPPHWDVNDWTALGEPASVDAYYWFFGAHAMYQVGGPTWKKWRSSLQAAVHDGQRRDGDEKGSWDPIGPWGRAGGRVYTTAMLTMALQAPYRYTRRFREVGSLPVR